MSTKNQLTNGICEVICTLFDKVQPQVGKARGDEGVNIFVRQENRREIQLQGPAAEVIGSDYNTIGTLSVTAMDENTGEVMNLSLDRMQPVKREGGSWWCCALMEFLGEAKPYAEKLRDVNILGVTLQEVADYAREHKGHGGALKVMQALSTYAQNADDPIYMLTGTKPDPRYNLQNMLLIYQRSGAPIEKLSPEDREDPTKVHPWTNRNKTTNEQQEAARVLGQR